jgi:hypothetical protein
MLCLAGAATGQAEQRLRWPTTSFRADMEVINGEARGPRSLKMTVYSAGENLRLDFRQGETPLSIILNRRARRMIAVSHDRRQAVLLGYRAKPDIAVMFNRARGKLTREQVEAVNGIRAVRYKFEGKNADGDTFDGHIWMTRHRIIVRMLEAKKRPGKARPFEMNLRNVWVGKLATGVFAPPKGYKVVDARKRPGGAKDTTK